MKNLIYVILVSLILFFSSCSNKKELSITFNGNIDGGDWMNINTIGYYGGINGNCCSKLDSINQYSYGFSKLLSEINPNPIQKVRITVWVKLTDISKRSILFISIKDSKNKELFWSGHELNSFVKKANEWCKIDVEELIAKYNTEGAKIGVCIWNQNKDIVYVDDFKIQFLFNNN